MICVQSYEKILRYQKKIVPLHRFLCKHVEMTILCIETSTAVCSAALWQDGVVVAQRLSSEGGNHAKLLPRFVEELVAQGPKPDAVAVSAGPGSYTGLRIGVSTAKGLSYGWQVPLVAVPTLEILCAAARMKMKDERMKEALLCPMIDARRMEVYTAMYDSALQPQSEVTASIVDETFAAQFGEDHAPVCYFGDGAAKCQEVLSRAPWQFIPDIVPEAQYIGPLAEERMKRKEERTKEVLEGSAVAYYEPFYLKEFVAAQSHVKGLV